MVIEKNKDGLKDFIKVIKCFLNKLRYYKIDKIKQDGCYDDYKNKKQ